MRNAWCVRGNSDPLSKWPLASECRRRSLIGLNAPLSYHKQQRRIILKSLIEILMLVFRCFDYKIESMAENKHLSIPHRSPIHFRVFRVIRSIKASCRDGQLPRSTHDRSRFQCVRLFVWLREHAAQLSCSFFPTAALVNLHRTFSGIF